MTQRDGPRSGLPLAAQIIALLLAVLVLGQAATVVAVVVLPPPRPAVYRIEDVAAALRGDQAGPRFGARLTLARRTAPPVWPAPQGPRERALIHELAQLLDTPDAAVRIRIEAPPLLALPFSARGPGGRRAWGPPEPPGGQPRGGGAAPGDHPGLQPEHPADPRVRPDHPGLVIGHFEVAVQSRDGGWLVASPPQEGFPNAWQARLLAWFAGCLAVLLPVGYVFARRLTAPLRRFAAAARRLGRDPHAPPLTLEGPAEIGAAAAALNDMQGRLARYVEDRTAMIGAVAHDLRTPLARMQFKLQRAAPALAASIRADIVQMEDMISAVLAFVRDVAPAYERTPIDLRSILEVVADDAADAGAEVSLCEGEALIVEGDAGALVRLFANLVDNAVKYGHRARIRLGEDGGEAVVTVEDDGPGIPADAVERVFEPFERLEGSRSRETGGMGLGLSVARSIARAHGGEATIGAAPGGGACLMVRLPVLSGAPLRTGAAPKLLARVRHSEDTAV